MLSKLTALQMRFNTHVLNLNSETADFINLKNVTQHC